MAVARGGFAGGNGSDKVLLHGNIVFVQCFVAAHGLQAADGGVFVSHRHAAVEPGPTGAVAGIKLVVGFTREVAEAKFVEVLGVAQPKAGLRLELILGEVRIEGRGTGRKEVTGVGAHLVQIDEDQREPLLHHFDAPDGFGLGKGKPIAVHVEVVVIGAPAGPRFVAFGRDGGAVRFQAFGDGEVLDEAIAAIGVLRRID